MRIFCFVILILALAGHQGVNAAYDDTNEPNDANDPNYPADPNELVRLKWDAAVSVLQNKDLDQQAKDRQIDKIVTPIFDFPLMAKLALGRDNWPKFTDPQREIFTQLFVKRLKASYQERITLYTDEKALFQPAVQQKNKNTIHIPMHLVSKDKETAVLYKLRKVDKRWKIYDVEIQGVSILLTYRSQFDDILRTATVEQLLARLQEPRPS
ncbi:MAG TPA: ABC transporter substrate-binding protein [Sedimentisphaerales bacterium]|nr:ABC transporter substrate-binding protein [Sedimentisphaerales bacterium]